MYNKLVLYLLLLAILTPLTIQIFQAWKKIRFLEPNLANDSCARIQRTAKLDPSHSLLESHKIMVSTIGQMLEAKNKSAAKLLDKVADRFSNQAEFWRFHRMRNQAAHEVDFYVSDDEAKEARKVFQKTLQDLVKK